MSQKPVRLGLIGIGTWMKRVHLPNLRLIPDRIEVAAFSTSKEEHAKEVREILKGVAEPKHHATADELLKDDSIEAVIVATPNPVHGVVARSAFERGKHVLCEKPLAVTLAEHDLTVAAAEKHGRVLQVGYELRHAVFTGYLEEHLRNGDVGETRMLWTHVLRSGISTPWRHDLAQTGGLFLEILSHEADLFRRLARSEPARVSAMGDYGASTAGKNFEQGWLNVEFKNGIGATMALSMVAPYDGEIEIGVHGTKGTIRAWYVRREFELLRDGSPKRLSRTYDPDASVEHGFSGARRQLETFAAAVRAGKAEPIADPHGRDALRICLAGFQSLKEGREVRL